MKLRPLIRSEDENSADYVMRVAKMLSYEDGSLLEDLPSVEAVFDFFNLWMIYDTDFMSGIQEAILEGEDRKPFDDFVKKYKLNWKIDEVQL